ncbi:MAG: DNA-3-methyladenine glycosylase, partial [Angelakisella sp.]
ECYCGECDTACHAHKGKTERTKVIYREGGCAYIYLCYGIHNLLNVVSGEEDFPEAVLIRGVEGFYGPGRLTKTLAIDRTLNGEDLVTSKQLWLEEDGTFPEYEAATRIGIEYATEEYREKLWRFTVKGVLK